MLPEDRLDPLPERDLGQAAALAPAFETQLDAAIRTTHEGHVTAVSRHGGIDLRVDHALDIRGKIVGVTFRSTAAMTAARMPVFSGEAIVSGGIVRAAAGTLSSARERSAMRSMGLSRPIERRRRSAGIGEEAPSVVRRCSMRLSTPPSEVPRVKTRTPASTASAAARIPLSQPTLSEHIHELEREMGAKLFDRAGRRVTLTDAGRAFAPHAAHIVASVGDARQAVSELDGLAHGTLLVGASTTPGIYVLPRVVAAFQRRHPGVTLTLTIANSRVIEERVRADELDIGCGAGSYGRLLQRSFDVVDAVEIFEPYVAAYGLPSLYRRVFVADALTFEFDYYDVVILGDVLEHLTEDDGVRLIERIYDRCDELVVAIPFLSEQAVEHGNPHEAHRQAAITHERFVTRYEGVIPYSLRYDYGVYVKDALSNRGIVPINDAFYLEEATRLLRGERNVTLVTAALTDAQADTLESVVRAPANLIVFAPPAIGERIQAARSGRATQIVSWDEGQAARDFPFADRLTPAQDPFALSTMFRLHDAACLDRFTSTHLFWVDAGAPRPEDVVAWSEKAPDVFVCGPSFFGGPKSVLRRASELYSGLLRAALERGWDGAAMTLLARTYPSLVHTVVA